MLQFQRLKNLFRTMRFTRGMIFLLVLGGASALLASETHPPSPMGQDSGFTEQADLYAMDLVPRKIKKILFRASALSKRGEYERVVSLLFEHLKERPDQDHYLIRLDLGKAYVNLLQYADAATHFRKAVEMEPQLDRAWIGLGDVTYKEKNYLVAAEAFEKGFFSSPERPIGVLYSAAAASLQGGDAETSLKLFLELESGRWGDMKHQWYRGLASASLQAEDTGEAKIALDRMLQRYPDDADSWFLIYQFAAGQQQYEEAAVTLTVTGYLRELSSEENDQLGDLYSMIGVPALSVDRYECSLPENPLPEQFEKLVSAFLAAHDSAGALKTLDKALQQGATPRLYALLGDVHYKNKDYEASRIAFWRVLELDEEYSRAYLMVGYCSVELGEKEEALDYLGQVVEDPEHGEIAQLLIQRALRLPDKPS